MGSISIGYLWIGIERDQYDSYILGKMLEGYFCLFVYRYVGCVYMFAMYIGRVHI